MAGSTPASVTANGAGLVAPAGGDVSRRRRVSLLGDAWRRFRRHKLALVSLVVLALFGPLLWKVAINEIDFGARLKGPMPGHPFGTDDLGQDIFARMLYGGRISLAVGIAAMSMAILVGVTIGAIAGISRGPVD